MMDRTEISILGHRRRLEDLMYLKRRTVGSDLYCLLNCESIIEFTARMINSQ